MQHRDAEGVQELPRVGAVTRPHGSLEERVVVNGAVKNLEQGHHLRAVARVEQNEDRVPFQYFALRNQFHEMFNCSWVLQPQ
jgi:hypothetical protein